MTTKIKTSVLAGLAALLVGSFATALQTHKDGRVDQILVKDDGYAYIKILGQDNMCSGYARTFGRAQIPLDTDHGKAMLDLALAANLSGMPVRAWTNDTADSCEVYQLETPRVDGSF